MDPGNQSTLSLFDQTQVYLARDPMDMRKQIDGLALIVQELYELDPFQPALFAFYNCQRDKVTVLYCTTTKSVCCISALRRGGFNWPHDVRRYRARFRA